MEVWRISCPSCGASMQVPPDVDRLNCAYCGSGWLVERSKDQVTLRVLEQVGQGLQEIGVQTQKAIREGTQITKDELRQLQLRQELSTLELLLANVQAEIRSLERQERNRQTKRHIKELRTQETHLQSRIQELRAVLVKESGVARPLEDAKRAGTTSNRGCLAIMGAVLRSKFTKGCLAAAIAFTGISCALFVVTAPIDRAVSLAVSSEVYPFSCVAYVISMILGALVFLYVLNPGAAIWVSFRDRFQSIRASRKWSVLAVVISAILCVSWLVLSLIVFSLVPQQPTEHHYPSDQPTQVSGLSSPPELPTQSALPEGDGYLRFMSGNGCTGSTVGETTDRAGQVINFKTAEGFKNDEARSLVLVNVRPGTVIKVYDSPSGYQSDDWTEVVVKSRVPEYCITSFEQSYEEDIVRIAFYRNNGLDGNVSRVEIH